MPTETQIHKNNIKRFSFILWEEKRWKVGKEEEMLLLVRWRSIKPVEKDGGM